ncbi:PTS sugar transporter subunit IIA [Marinilactibacillus psychrotolerans]|uniref:Mannose/fructose-specific PTS system IIA component n=1 Tax=Marinilactibacillus psychrotolerans TaxID=191770 RepID=A0AAV3WWY4_9LACT|nr:PTS mannose transporter subunit IIA [Marinilactibacillus psychrotolerans]GEL67032.1 PTS mannose transporter subunit IIA [Marinilactibacillus psychrotolerans]GEQ36177.1 mannose/fructose-specific PTS system IIA component [Marinilactibacillus psychrotolerans]SDC76942.1 PTS system, mannose-specific IIA component [Marinilactibacillus psychrotolerans]
MRRKIILASHGNFATGILSSLELICGKNDNIVTIDAYMTADYNLNDEISKIMNENKGNELIVVTDIFGGSVNNEFLNYIHTENFYLIAGMNLPLVIELATQLEHTDSITALIKQALENSIMTIQFCNETIQNETEEEDF